MNRPRLYKHEGNPQSFFSIWTWPWKIRMCLFVTLWSQKRNRIHIRDAFTVYVVLASRDVTTWKLVPNLGTKQIWISCGYWFVLFAPHNCATRLMWTKTRSIEANFRWTGVFDGDFPLLSIFTHTNTKQIKINVESCLLVACSVTGKLQGKKVNCTEWGAEATSMRMEVSMQGRVQEI